MPSPTAHSTTVRNEGDMPHEIAADIPRQRLVLEDEAPLHRCKHWKFADHCALCRYEEKYPELCSAA
jgi:hypothetical protein